MSANDDTIWKFPFEITGDITIAMPSGATVLSVQVQDGRPCIWALCQPGANKVPKRFLCFGTGHPVEHAGEFVGTIQLESLVWHIFRPYSPDN